MKTFEEIMLGGGVDPEIDKPLFDGSIGSIPPKFKMYTDSEVVKHWDAMFEANYQDFINKRGRFEQDNTS